MNHEPIKPLFEDVSAPNELRNFVSLARSDGASQADLDRLAKRMAPVLGVSAAFIASSAGAIGSSAPLSATGAFGAPASGLTAPALGAASATKVGAASAAKAGLFSQLMASAGAKVLAVSLSIGAAGVAVYNATTSQRPPSGPHVAVAKQVRSARPNALPEGSAPGLHGDSTTTPGVTDSPTPVGGTAPVVEALAVAEAAPRVAQRAGRSASVSAHLSTAARKASAARHAAPESVPVSAPDQPLTEEPSAAQAKAEQPSLPSPSELSLIEHAEASRTRPIEALAFLAKHEEIYPRGALAQEREVLAIELLLKAGKSSQAEARAERFADVYPRSAHLPHLRALLTRANAK